MTNSAKLEEIIRKSGLKRSAIMEQLNITAYETLRAKIENRRDFKVSEIEKLCAVLGLDRDQREAIFFAHNAESHSA